MIRGFVVDKADYIVDLIREVETEQLLQVWTNYYMSDVVPLSNLTQPIGD